MGFLVQKCYLCILIESIVVVYIDSWRGSIGIMRATLLFLVLVVVVLVAYILVPVEQMQSRAKDTIEQAQLLHNSLDLDAVVDGFGSLFEGQKYVLPGEVSGQGGAVALSGDAYMSCADEVLLCPDGSVVGRLGPDCVFAPCPGVMREQVDVLEEGGSAVLMR